MFVGFLLITMQAAFAAETGNPDERKEAAERASAAAGASREPGMEIDASQLSKPPRLKNKATPEFPPDAIGKVKEEVKISLLVDLDDKGEVTGVTVVSPKEKTGLGFEEAAITAAYQLSFEPAEVQDRPVAVQIQYEFRFIPPKPAPAPEPKSAPIEKPAPIPVENFSGVLLERGTRLPMSGIVITVYRNEEGKPKGFESTTDSEGKFQFFDLEIGRWKVLAETPGYYPFRTTEEIKTGEGIRVTYFIEKGSYSPFDIVVSATKPKKEVTKVVIDNKVIERTPGAMGDPLAVIQNFAGVARVQGMMGQIVVRGSAPKDTQILIDSANVPLAYHFAGLRSVIPVGMIENLEFYPGNFGPYYGRSNGGVIDVTLKKLKPKRFGGYADINLLDSGLYLEAPLGDKGAIAVAGRRSYIDYIINAVVPDNAPVNLITAPVYYDWQILATYRPAPAHDLRLFVFSSDDRFRLLFKNPGRLGTEVTGNSVNWSTTFYRGIATWKYVPNDRFENTLHLSQGRDDLSLTFFQFIQNIVLDSTELRDTARLSLSKQVAFTAGLDTMLYFFSGFVRAPSPPREGEDDMSIDLTKVIESEFDGNYIWPGAFIEAELRPTSSLLLLPGIRYDYFSEISQHTLAPRMTLRYQVGAPIALKGGVGLFYQPPTPDESDASFGNPAVKCERAIHYSLGAEWKTWLNLTVDLTGFYKDLDQLISRTEATTIRNGVTVPLRYDNNGRGTVYGLELVLRQELTTKFTGWIAYTLSRSKRTESGETKSRLFQYDQPHILTAVLMYTLPRNWQISTRFRLVSGNPITPVVGSVFNSNSGEDKPTMGEIYSARNAPFHQLDVRIDKRWIYNRWMFNAYLDIQNIYNRANVEGIEYNYDFSEQKPRQGIPIYPILGLRAEF
jgi:TonB family protein